MGIRGTLYNLRLDLLRAFRSREFDERANRKRWLNINNHRHSWGGRAEQAAALIPAGSSVVDLGCGRMALKDHLPEGCAYTPVDLVAWTPEVVAADFDAHEFPDGKFDVGAVLGVAEYLSDLPWFFREARAACDRLIVSFNHPTSRLKKYGWRNLLDREAFEALLNQAGWTVETSLVIREEGDHVERLYVSAPTATA